MCASRSSAPSMQATSRVDKWLWCARFFRTRAAASRYCIEGGLRINRIQTSKPHHAIHIGDVLTFVLGPHVRVIRVVALAERRGPSSTARTLYVDLSPPSADRAIVRSEPCLD